MPVKTAVRDGLQAGASQWALVKRIPEAAKRSRFGVLAWGWPPRQPTQSLRSSIAMNNRLGRSAALTCKTTAQREQRIVKKRFMQVGWRTRGLVPPSVKQTSSHQLGGTSPYSFKKNTPLGHESERKPHFNHWPLFLVALRGLGGPPRGIAFSSISVSNFSANAFISFTLSGC